MGGTAQEIYQANLDAFSVAVMAGDMRAALEQVAIPNLMATSDCEIVIASAEMFDIVMSDFRQKMLDSGVIGYRRTCTEAAFVPGMTDMIAGRHHSLLTLEGGKHLPPYQNRMVLLRIDGAWQSIWLQTEVKNTELELLSPDIAAAQAEAHRLLEQTGRAMTPPTSDPERREPK